MVVIEFDPELRPALEQLKRDHPGLLLASTRSGFGTGGDATLIIHVAELGVMAIQTMVIAWIRSGKARKVKIGAHTYTGYSADDVMKIETALKSAATA